MMGFEILPIGTEDEDTYDVLTVTSPDHWKPHRFIQNDSPTLYYDPTDETGTHDESYPAMLNHLQAPQDTNKAPPRMRREFSAPC